MTEILLAQPVLPDSSWIDTSVGEPHIIRNNLLKNINLESCMPKMSSDDFVYPSPCGDPKLVEFLEAKHGGKVIITNGAKQALASIFYALNKLNINDIGMHHPYWALIPPLADIYNIKTNKQNDPGNGTYEAELVIAPNNPDGSMKNLKTIQENCVKNDIIMIHDAAYYTGSYNGQEFKQEHFGDVQVYSMSKMFGLSSLRIGYVVCKNDQLYKLIQYYMEHVTVGVSKMPQMFLYNIFNSINLVKFEKDCFDDLNRNKEIVKNIKKSILDVNVPDYGMFLWCKLNSAEAFKAAKLNIISGKLFGNEEFVRLNLAFDNSDMQEIVDRLNSTEF